MKFYETTLVFRRDLSPTQVDELTAKYEKLLTVNSGKKHKGEYWGLLSLAYPIKKNTKAHYVFMVTSTTAESLEEVNRQIGLDESLLRSMIVCVDEVDDRPSPMMKIKTKYEGGRRDA